MATVLANLTGDLSDIIDQDFTKALVRVHANTDYVVDPDNDKIRVLELKWQTAAVDGTFRFDNLIAAADTVVPGTLQYYLDVKVKGIEAPVTLGPYVLGAGDQDITTLDEVTPVDFNSTVPIVVDGDILAAAEGYTDGALAGHVADPDPHVQYLRLRHPDGTPVDAPFILVPPGAPFPPVVVGAYMIYGGI